MCPENRSESTHNRPVSHQSCRGPLVGEADTTGAGPKRKKTKNNDAHLVGRETMIHIAGVGMVEHIPGFLPGISQPFTQ